MSKTDDLVSVTIRVSESTLAALRREVALAYLDGRTMTLAEVIRLRIGDEAPVRRGRPRVRA